MFSIDNYNEIIGGLYKSNPKLFMYSPAFCRCEGQTYLYSKWSGNQSISKPKLIISVLRFAAKALRDVVFSLIAKPVHIKVPPRQAIFVFSYFDSRNDDSGVLREEYFRGILEGRSDMYCFYKIVSSGNFLRGVQYLRLISKLKKSFHAYGENSFISLFIIVKALCLTLVHFFKFASYKFPADTDRTLVSLLKSEHLREILDGTVYFGYQQKLLFEKLLKYQPKLILSVWENKPWERVLESVKKRISPSTISKGFQHTGFSKKLLQHYPSSVEGDLDTYPDYIINNGLINRDELANNSVVSSNIIVGGALRQDSMLRAGVPKIKDIVSERPINIAYAFSWDQSAYEKILRDLELLPEGVKVHLKFHPDYPDWCYKKDLPPRFINSSASWAEVGRTCSLVLADDNSLMFEGYYHGMHTAVYDGADLSGAGKRDFGSPLVHLLQSDLPFILNDEIINRINTATCKIFETSYLDRYFVQRNFEDLKSIFLNDLPPEIDSVDRL